jgi:hypothetical protein
MVSRKTEPLMSDDDRDRVYTHVGDMCCSRVKGYIDGLYPIGGSPESDRYQACVQAGKALMVLGISFLGNGLGINDPERTIRPMADLLAKLKADAEALIAKLESER